MLSVLQAELMKDMGLGGGRTKAVVDPFLRMVGAENVIVLGDCSAIQGAMLPATAQVSPFPRLYSGC